MRLIILAAAITAGLLLGWQSMRRRHNPLRQGGGMLFRGWPGVLRPHHGKSKVFGLILTVLAALTVSGVAGVSPALADTTPTIYGTSWMGGYGVNACDNSLGGTTCGGDPAVGSPWQCVELAQRLYYRRGWHTANSGYFPGVSYAYQIYSQAGAMGMSTHANGKITSIVPGDMIVHGQAISSDAGHVALVDYVGSDGVHVVEQNYSGTAHRAVYGFSNGTLSRTLNDSSGYLMPILGVVHSPNNGGSGSGGSSYQMAFQANTGNLIAVGAAGGVNTGQGMAASTSPRIARLTNGTYQIAFQANTGYLFTYNSATGPVNLGQGIKAGTSPNITALPNGGYEIAFQANTGALITVGTAGSRNWGYGMMSGTSPSIVATPPGSTVSAMRSPSRQTLAVCGVSAQTSTVTGSKA